MDFDEVKNIVLAPGNIGREVSAASGAARLACMDIAYSLFALTDFGRAAETIDLYTDDIVMDIEGKRIDRAGRVERCMKRQANTARKTRHQVTNFLFRQTDARTAYSLSVVAIYLEDQSGVKGLAPITVADCSDKYNLCDDGRWRIAYRCLKEIAGAAH